MSQTYTANVLDPCESTILAWDPVVPADFTFTFNSGNPVTHSLIAVDSKSQLYGDQSGLTFCGARTYESLSPLIDYVTVSTGGDIEITTTDVANVNTNRQVDI